MGICHTGYADSLLASSQHNLYVLLCVQCWTPDDGQRICSKHVEFYSKNKFEKLVHLFGFIIRKCHEARSRECEIFLVSFVVSLLNVLYVAKEGRLVWKPCSPIRPSSRDLVSATKAYARVS